MSAHKRVGIVGGGIAGLAAAYHLGRRIREKDLPVECRLFEAEETLGGVIRTERRDGFLLDTGPDSLFRGKPAAIELACEIGLGGELLDARRQELPTLIYSRGRLRPLPAGLELVAPTRILPFLASGLISTRGKIRMFAEPFVPARRDGAEESVAGFVRRRFGAEAARVIAGPLLAGIHAGDPERLSVEATFPRLVEMERRHGSLTRAIAAARRSGRPAGAGAGEPGAPAGPPFVTFRGGIRRIVEALDAAIRGVEIETGRRAAAVERAARGFVLRFEGRDAWEVDAVVVAVPAARAADLLRGAAPAASEALARIRYVSSATVFLGYRPGSAGPVPGCTGFLVPGSEGLRIFGCTFVTNKFEGRGPEGSLLVRAFVGGALDEAAADLPDGEMVGMVRGALARAAGLRAEPSMVHVCRWPEANPQYEVGHREILRALDRALAAAPGLFVTGSACRGVGIPDGVVLGREAAGQALAALGMAS